MTSTFEWISRRESVSAHDSSLLNSETGLGDYEAQSNLIEDFKVVFNDQQLIFGAYAEQIPDEQIRKRRLQRQFYTSNLMVTPKVKLFGEGTRELGNTPERCQNVFLKNVTGWGVDAKDSTRTLQLSALIDGVGTGKSTYVNSILSSEKVFELVASKDIWFIRVNVQKLQSFTPCSLCKELYERVKYIQNEIKRLIPNSTLFDESDSDIMLKKGNWVSHYDAYMNGSKSEVACEELVDATIEYINTISSNTGRRLLFILDNIDSVFHEKDEIDGMRIMQDFSCKKVISKNDSASLKELMKLLKDVTSKKGRWSKLDGSLLIVMRNDVYSLLKDIERSHGGTSERIPVTNCYTLDVDKGHVLDVIRLRMRYVLIALALRIKSKLREYKIETEELPKKIVYNIDDFAMSIKDDLDKLKNVDAVFWEAHEALIKSTIKVNKRVDPSKKSSKNNTIIEQLLTLSGSGLRGAIRTYQPFSWAQYELEPHRSHFGENQYQKLIETPALVTIVHILGAHARFSEKKSLFPNIYLSSIDSEEVKGDKYPDYWLIPLLVHYIGKRTARTVNDILTTFCNFPYDKKKKGYFDLQKVCNLLTRMQKIGRSRLIKIDKSLSGEDITYDKVTLTDRAIEMFYGSEDAQRSALVCSFTYLQLVVDDPELLLPTNLHQEFAVNDFKKVFGTEQANIISPGEVAPFKYQKDKDYSYIVGVDFAEKYSEVIDHKYVKVARFLGLLSAMKTLEAKKYKRVWCNVSDNYPCIFNTEDVLNSITTHVARIPLPKHSKKNEDYINSEYKNYEGYFIRLLDSKYRVR